MRGQSWTPIHRLHSIKLLARVGYEPTTFRHKIRRSRSWISSLTNSFDCRWQDRASGSAFVSAVRLAPQTAERNSASSLTFLASMPPKLKEISRLVHSHRHPRFLLLCTNRTFELFAYGIFSRWTYQSTEAAFRCNGNGLNWFARKISEKPTSQAPKPMLEQRAP